MTSERLDPTIHLPQTVSTRRSDTADLRPGVAGPSTLLNYGRQTQRTYVAWFLRAVESPSKDWACRFGTFEYDRHVTIEEAIGHLRLISLSLGPAELYVHHTDGRIDALGTAIPRGDTRRSGGHANRLPPLPGE